MKYIILISLYLLYSFSVTAVQITGVTASGDRYYIAGEDLSFTIHFDLPVTVDAGARPFLPLTVGTRSVGAVYINGSGTNDLTFFYHIHEGDEDADGVIPGPAIFLNGSFIQDINGNDADLMLQNIDNMSGVLVSTTHPSVMLSTTAPVLVNTPFTVDIVFSEVVSGLQASAFQLSNIAYVDEPQTTDGITYTMEITPSADGPIVIQLGAALVQSQLTGNDNTASNTLSVTADITDPEMIGVAVPTDGYYNAGQTLGFLVYYNENVFVDTTAGLPYMAVNIDGTTVPAWYIGGSGTDVLAFWYDVQAGDMDMDGITLGGGLSLGGGATIRDNAGNEAKLIFTNVGNTSDVFVNTLHPSVVLSSTAPAIVNAAFTLDITFSEAVTNFIATDLIVTNGTATNLQTTDQIYYTVQITPAANGPVNILLPKNAAINIGRNGNTSATLSRTAFIGGPVINADQSFSINEHTPVGTVVGTLTASGPLQNWTITPADAFAIDPATGVITVKDANIPAGIVTLTVTVSDGVNTSLPATVKITVVHIPVAPTDILLDNTTIPAEPAIGTLVGHLSAVTAETGVTFTYTVLNNYFFSTSGNQLQTASGMGTGMYPVGILATDNNGLTVQKNFTITVVADLKLNISNVLTPNGDGKNDLWIIHNLESYPDNEVTVYDRAGRVVYHQKNYINNWNGTINGKPLATETYYYVLTIPNKTIKGFISVLN
jgi:gliding motility-associated-like protein